MTFMAVGDLFSCESALKEVEGTAKGETRDTARGLGLTARTASIALDAAKRAAEPRAVLGGDAGRDAQRRHVEDRAP